MERIVLHRYQGTLGRDKGFSFHLQVNRLIIHCHIPNLISSVLQTFQAQNYQVEANSYLTEKEEKFIVIDSKTHDTREPVMSPPNLPRHILMVF